MRRRVIKYEQFLVWVFFMDKGDVKTFSGNEITRNLDTFGDMTINSITVFIKGRFVTHLDGQPPRYSTPGMGGERFVVANSFKGFRLEALEDGCEYHCILPRDHKPRFWNRKVEIVNANWRHDIPANRYVYVASGHLKYANTHMTQYSLFHTKLDISAATLQESIIATMWLDVDAQV